MQIGGTKIKSMIIEIVDTPVLPKDFQGDFIDCRLFRAQHRPAPPHRRWCAGHKLETLAPILTSIPQRLSSRGRSTPAPMVRCTSPTGSTPSSGTTRPHCDIQIATRIMAASGASPPRDDPWLKVPQLAKMNAANLRNNSLPLVAGHDDKPSCALWIYPRLRPRPPLRNGLMA